MKMKKFLLSLGLIAMAFNLTNCSQYEDVNSTLEPKGDFEIYASATRTANDEMNTVWSTGDQLNVFHAVTDVTTYTKDGAFTLDNAETGRFTGNLNGTLDVEEEYDWFALYPYSSYVGTPANKGTNGYMVVGHAVSSKTEPLCQTQNGNNSTAHLAGSNLPLAGVAKAVSASSAPTIEMSNLASVLEFNVANHMGEAITVSEISFTAPVDIVGTYFINFVNMEKVELTGSGDGFVANTAKLVVENGSAIKADDSAKFYLAIKPFTATANSELTVKVTAMVGENEYTYSKTIKVAADTKFSAGMIKTVGVNYEVELPSAEEIVETIDFSKQGYANAQVITSYAGENCEITFNKGESSNNTAYYTTGTALRCYAGSYFTIASIKTIVKVEFVFTTDDNNAITATPGTLSNKTWTGSANSIKFTIGGSSGHRRLQKITITYVDEGLIPVLSVNPTSIAFDGTGGTETVECTIDGGVDGISVRAEASEDWVKTSVSGKTITITATANTGDARNATVTISYPGAESKTVTVSQEEKPAGDVALPAGTVLFNETWGSYTGAVSSYKFTGTTVYDSDTSSLKYTVTSTNVKCEATTANPIKSNNCFFDKAGTNSLTISGIKLHGAAKVTLTYVVNRTNMSVTASLDGGSSTSLKSASSSGTNTATISTSGKTSLSLTFKDTGNKANIRLDDIKIVVAQ